MTCIVAYKQDNAVWMGGDAFAGTSSYALSVPPKVFGRETPAGEKILFGFCGDFRQQVLVHEMNLPDALVHETADYYVGSVLVDAMRRTFESAGFLKRVDGIEGAPDDNTILVAFRGQIFSIWDDFSVCRVLAPYQAVGSGYAVAMGAMYILSVYHAPQPKKDGEAMVGAALYAAEEHSPFVRKPFTIIGATW